MNNLNEQYRTLLRRGMPEHGDVYFIEGAGWFVHSDPIDEKLADDLITMHACRWANDQRHWPGGHWLIPPSLTAIEEATRRMGPK